MSEAPKLSVDDQAFLDEAEAKIRRHGRYLVDEVLGIGETLVGVKSRVAPGQYREFVTWRLGWHERTAQRFVAIYQMFCELSMAQSVDGRTDKLSARRDLAIPISALYLLARPSTPKDVRDQVLERVQQSGGISLAETRSVILQVSRSAGVASPAEFVVERSEKSPSAPIRLQISREERVRPTMTGRDMLADSIRLAQRQIVHFETRFSQDFGFIDALTPVRDLLHAARDKVEELLRDYRDET